MILSWSESYLIAAIFKKLNLNKFIVQIKVLLHFKMLFVDDVFNVYDNAESWKRMSK